MANTTWLCKVNSIVYKCCTVEPVVGDHSYGRPISKVRPLKDFPKLTFSLKCTCYGRPHVLRDHFTSPEGVVVRSRFNCIINIQLNNLQLMWCEMYAATMISLYMFKCMAV